MGDVSAGLDSIHLETRALLDAMTPLTTVFAAAVLRAAGIPTWAGAGASGCPTSWRRQFGRIACCVDTAVACLVSFLQARLSGYRTVMIAVMAWRSGQKTVERAAQVTGPALGSARASC